MADYQTYYYNPTLGQYCYTPTKADRYGRSTSGRSFQLCMSTRGDLLAHICAFEDDIEDVAHRWSKEPGFSHLNAEKIRTGITEIRKGPAFSSYGSYNERDNKPAAKQPATVEQVYTLGTVAYNKASEASNAVTQARAEFSNETRLLHKKMNDAVLLLSTPNSSSETHTVKQELNAVRQTVSDLEASALAAERETVTLRHSTGNIEQSVGVAMQSITTLQAENSTLKRTLDGVLKEVDLLGIIAKQSVEVNDSKRLCTETARYMRETKEMLEASKRDQETIAVLRSEMQDLTRHREATEAPQAPSSLELAATVEALKLELAALKRQAGGEPITAESNTLVQREKDSADLSAQAHGGHGSVDSEEDAASRCGSAFSVMSSGTLDNED